MKKSLILAAAVVSALSSARGALLTITDQVTGFSALNSSAAANTNAAATSAAVGSNSANSYEIDVFAQISNLTGTQIAFGNMLFDVSLTNLTGDTSGTRALWAGNNPTVVIDADGNTAPQFAQNNDFGTSTTDLKAITVGLAGGLDPADPRLAVMQGTKFRIGRFWVSYAGGATPQGTIHVSVTPQGGGVTFSTSNSTAGSPTVLTATTDPVTVPTDLKIGAAAALESVSLTAGAGPGGSPVIALTRTGNGQYLPGGATTSLGSSAGDFTITGLGPDSPLGSLPVVLSFSNLAGGAGLQSDASTLGGKYEANLAGLLADAPWVAGLTTPFNAGDQFVLLNLAEPAGGGTSADLHYTGLSANVDQAAAVPEPTTISLAGIGAVLAMGRRRRQA